MSEIYRIIHNKELSINDTLILRESEVLAKTIYLDTIFNTSKFSDLVAFNNTNDRFEKNIEDKETQINNINKLILSHKETLEGIQSEYGFVVLKFGFQKLLDKKKIEASNCLLMLVLVSLFFFINSNNINFNTLKFKKHIRYCKFNYDNNTFFYD